MMKKSVLFLLLLSTFMSVQAYKPWTKGAFETGKYRNVFAEMGYTQAAIDAKLKDVFNDVFRGPTTRYTLKLAIRWVMCQTSRTTMPVQRACRMV